MNILITGADGFIGRNLIASLENIRDGKDCSTKLLDNLNLFKYDISTNASLLDEFCAKADFVFHLAGVNRPENPTEFMIGNYEFTSLLLDTLKKYNNKCPIVLTSSTQATLDNPYGKSKKAGEELLFTYEKETGTKIFIFRLPNIFGKWCKPNYNSVVATFCYNIAHGLPINIKDPNISLTMAYIDDVVKCFINLLLEPEYPKNPYCYIPTEYSISLGELAKQLYSFYDIRENSYIPNMSDELTKKLYATYISYLPEDQFSYSLKMNVDHRGSFTECFRTEDRGQFSVNISKPGIIKGNHWHHTKNEKFIVVSGKGVIRFRKVGEKQIHQYFVSDEKLEAIDIPTGYIHNIENLGDTDLVTLMWCNECFDPKQPDTYFEEV